MSTSGDSQVSEFERAEQLEAASSYWDEMLAYRPPLPVDYPDIEDYEVRAVGYQAAAPGYALIERLPRYQAAMADLFRRPLAIPRVGFDLYSSIPLYAQANRGLEFRRCSEQAEELVSALFSAVPVKEVASAKRGRSKDYAESDPWLNQIHSTVGGDRQTRRVLKAAIERVLYTLNSYDMADGKRDESTRRLERRFREVLASQYDTYTASEPAEDIESRWQIKFVSERQPVTYLERIAMTPCRSPASLRSGKRMVRLGFSDAEIAQARKELSGSEEVADQDIDARTLMLRGLVRSAIETIRPGEEIAQRYIDWQAQTLARIITESKGKYQVARFVSIDIAEPIEIAMGSINSLPRNVLNLHMFPHAIKSLETPQHVVQDCDQELQVPNNSISLITCFEGWPFNTSLDGLSDEEVEAYCIEGMNRIFGWYKKLAYGGKLVIFPWMIRRADPRIQVVLEAIESELSLRLGHGVRSDRFHPATLKEPMSKSELAIAEKLSGIFAGNRDVRTLIVEKPNKKFVEAHMQAYPSRVAIAAQDQD